MALATRIIKALVVMLVSYWFFRFLGASGILSDSLSTIVGASVYLLLLYKDRHLRRKM